MQTTVPGFPDVLAVVEGRVFFFEMKAPIPPVRKDTKIFGSSHKVTTRQQHELLYLVHAGAKVGVVVFLGKHIYFVSGPELLGINDLTTATIEKYMVASWDDVLIGR